MTRLLTIFSLLAIVMLAACGGGGSDDADDGSTSPGSGDALDDNLEDVIQWDRSPTSVVFSIDVVSADGVNGFYERAEIPLCAIYGDGRVVWTNDSAEDQLESVLFGPLDDQRIRRFVNDLTVQYELYTYGREADLQGDSEVPVVETITLSVNGLTHVTDIFGGWTDELYLELLNICQTLSPRPQIYRPDGAWLRVEERPYNTNAPSILWDPEVTGLDMSEVAASGQPVWVEGQLLRLLWTYRQRGGLDMQYGQTDGNYVAVLEIPGVTRNAPPSPEE